MFDLTEHSHRRFNPLTREWVLVSPHRTDRPWLGQTDTPNRVIPSKYGPECYLCPGNERAAGHVNPDYKSTFVFENDFAALRPNSNTGDLDIGRLIVAKGERGVCRVVCFSPDHGRPLARMGTNNIVRVIDELSVQYSELGTLDVISYVQIFENRGEMMGASNPHPHCQIWATESLPNEPAKEIDAQREYSLKGDKCLLCDYLKLEATRLERLVCANQFFTALVPFWAVYPFEIMILSNGHRHAIDEFDEPERLAFADILKRVTMRYDNLFLTPFPYSMGLHQRPTDGAAHEYSHFHAHFYPPLLRSASVRKFLVGFELLGGPQRDITPEAAAARLRNLSEIHYLDT